MLKSKLFLLVMAFFFLIAFSSLQAANVIVDNSGAPNTFLTIQAAIDDANTVPGDSIHVRVGTGAAYAGAIVNKNNLRIGAEYSVRVDDGLPTTFGVHGFVITANGGSISGFEIFGFDHGISVTGAGSGNTIYNNYIHNNNWGVVIASPAEAANTVTLNCFFRQTNSPQCWDGNPSWPVIPPFTTWTGNSYDDWSGVPGWYVIAAPALALDPAPVGIWNRVRVQPPATSIGKDSTFIIYVRFEPPTGCKYTPVDLMSIEYNVTYNPTYLDYVSAENANNLFPITVPPTTQTIITPSSGSINVAQTFLGGIGTPLAGNMVKITFKGKALVTGTPINVAMVDIVDTGNNPMTVYPAAITNGAVNVNDIINPVITKVLPISGQTYGPAGIAFTDVEATDDIGLWYMEWDLDAGGWNTYGTQGWPYPTFFDFAALTNAVFTVGWFNSGGVSQGLHTIKLRARDAYAGNYSAPVTWTFYKDTQPPTLTSVTLTDTIASVAAEPGWSNDLNVKMTIAATPDAESMWFESSNITSPNQNTWLDFAPNSVATLTTLNGNKTVWVKVKDLYGNVSGWVSYTITLDQTPPALDSLVLDGGAPYNNTGIASAVLHGFTWPDPEGDDFFKEEFTGDLTPPPTGWIDPAGTVAITLSPGDNGKTINVQIRDKAGNTSAIRSDGIILDTSFPSGTLTLKSTSSATTPPNSPVYTPVQAVTCVITSSGATDMAFLAGDGVTWYNGGAWIPIGTTSGPYSLLPWAGQGQKRIALYLRDAALNVNGPIWAFIIRDNVVPLAPISFSAVPGGSVELSWTNAAQVAKTRIRVKPWNGYPEYPFPVPGYPGFTDSFFVADVPATPGTNTHTYSGPKDIYYFSAFAIDSAGNWSGASQDRATSYVLGDIVEGGSVNFDDVEFFSDWYNTSPAIGDAAKCDFYPTDDGTPSGIPDIHDDAVDFDDLVFLALNYGSGTVKVTPVYPFGPIVLNLNIGDKVSVGDEFEAKLTINDASSVKAMHIVLDYDKNVLQLLGVSKGELSTDPSIFFWADKEKVDISLAKLGRGLVIGGSGEVATLKFKMVSQGTTELTSNLLDVRDVNGKPIEVSFNKVNLVAVPIAFALSQNYPNPFNPKTQISFALPVASKVTLKIYNITGQLVKTLVDAEIPAGHHTVTWSGTNSSGSEVGTGIYFYRLQTENFTSVKKMVLMK